MACFSGVSLSDTRRKRVGRETSENSPGQYIYLPNCVFRWNRSHIENVLHIYFENHSSPTQEILCKIPKIKTLGNKQKEHIAILKRSNFVPILDYAALYYDHEIAKMHLKKSLQEVESKFPHGYSTDSSLSAGERAFIFTWICHYISALGRLVDIIIRNRDSKNKTFKTPFICEDSYASVVSAFAAMCGLRVDNGNKDTQCEWERLRGMDSVVIGKPDLRFLCTGENFSTKDNFLTVTEVKNKGQYTDDDKLKWRQQDKLDRREKRRRLTVSNSTSFSSSTESDEQTSLGKCFPKTESYTPYIEYDVGELTLGQHAGELLLDLHTYMLGHTSEQKPSVLTMPGMIIDKNMVYLTLLEISYQHYEKLATIEELTSEDRATVYYTSPLNMYQKENITALIDTLVKLNNIDSILKYED